MEAERQRQAEREKQMFLKRKQQAQKQRQRERQRKAMLGRRQQVIQQILLLFCNPSLNIFLPLYWHLAPSDGLSTLGTHVLYT